MIILIAAAVFFVRRSQGDISNDAYFLAYTKALSVVKSKFGPEYILKFPEFSKSSIYKMDENEYMVSSWALYFQNPREVSRIRFKIRLKQVGDDNWFIKEFSTIPDIFN